ncbi:MAG: CBS domain-containing protein [Arenicellales bacterium]|jgi:CBS domain-containing protein|nr:CBS domain-containing protein [Gammaproteobacteria bacterium]NDA14703.1 CBS domain-containing protein [Gammaproteobacteria bacterium]NDG44675.1 CBS domain-containing protein [Gammaproteobacteria bacterium]
MKSIEEIIAHKGSVVLTVSPDDTVYDALALMAQHGIGALLVVENEKPCGFVSERDYARKVALQGLSSKEVPIRDIMASPVVYVQADLAIDKALGIMSERGIRHLPVLGADGVLCGMVSIRDLARAIIAEQKFTIEQLQQYIYS